jgi:hypothetical protein
LRAIDSSRHVWPVEGGHRGAFLFEGDEAAYVRSEAFERRLEDARAFGRACNALPDRFPDLSAKTGLSEGQRAGINALVGCGLVFLVLQPLTLAGAIVTFLSSVFALIVLLRLTATMSAFFARPPATPARTLDSELPPLTILVALYDEADVAPDLIEAIGQLDYPASKLDVKLLVEADDAPTIDAIREAQPPGWFEILPVPPGEPRTKPKALNYGLSFARGDFVAVFDAEDRPSPEQPREAIAAFRKGPSNLAVVQAPLSIHNDADGWLARQFTVEYDIHFKVWLPFLARLRLPLALGGTSNYFCRKRLKAPVAGMPGTSPRTPTSASALLVSAARPVRSPHPPSRKRRPA